MRLNLTLIQKYRNQSIPYSYQYYLSSFIYQKISAVNPVYSKWLHEKGIESGNKKFKFFTFSQLNIPERETQKDSILIKSPAIFLTVSLSVTKILESFIAGLFKEQEMFIQNGGVQSHFKITHAEMKPEPDFREIMQFKTLSPVVIKKKVLIDGKEKVEYLSPENPEYFEYLKRNIEEKYLAWCQFTGQQINEYKLNDFKLLDNPKSSLISIKKESEPEIKIRGFKYSFEINGNPEFLKLGYETGFGINNSLGFGCVEEIKKKN